MIQYERRERFEASRDGLWAWHARPGAFRRLSPPWQDVRPVAEPSALEEGTRMVFDLRAGPFAVRWVAEHRAVQPGHGFDDLQVAGPFASWHHRHRFTDATDGRAEIHDHVTLELPGGRIVEAFAGPAVRRDLERLFSHRSAVLHGDLRLHQDLGAERPWTLGVSGASGLVGRTLAALATTGGHRIVPLVRGAAPQPGAVRWSPAEGVHPADLDRLEGIDAVVHLAGASLHGSWTPGKRRSIRDSRITGTTLLIRSLHRLRRPPAVFLSASGVGWYGDRGDLELTEGADRGTGFLAEVCRDWEAAAARATDLGSRVVRLRFGLVLSPRGGALPRLLGPTRLGLGAVLGSGDQQTSWITVDDAAGAILHAIAHPEIEGPLNVTAPHPVSLETLARTTARVLRRPLVLRLPAAAVRVAFGERAEETILASARAVPARLTETGYRFRHATVEKALRYLLGRARAAQRS